MAVLWCPHRLWIVGLVRCRCTRETGWLLDVGGGRFGGAPRKLWRPLAVTSCGGLLMARPRLSRHLVLVSIILTLVGLLVVLWL